MKAPSPSDLDELLRLAARHCRQSPERICTGALRHPFTITYGGRPWHTGAVAHALPLRSHVAQFGEVRVAYAGLRLSLPSSISTGPVCRAQVAGMWSGVSEGWGHCRYPAPEMQLALCRRAGCLALQRLLSASTCLEHRVSS